MGHNVNTHKVIVRSTHGKVERDFTSGNLFKQIILFSIPIILTNVLQLVFNTADVAVLGILVSDRAVAAVGSTTALVNLFTNFFVGVSIGTNIVVSKKLGASDNEGVKKIIGMSLPLSLVIGGMLVLVGLFLSEPMLILMNCDEAVLPMAVKYIQIYFIGMPLVMLYNFYSSVLRAVGDSKSPLIYLVLGGVLNVLFNVLFIVVAKMDVEGVAIATVISQGVAAVLCIVQLLRAKGVARFEFKYAKFYKKELLDILKIGIPSGIQSSLFSIANVFIQSTVNLFGEFAMAGASYSSQVENYVNNAMTGVATALITIIGQNVGAENYERAKKAIILGTVINFTMGLTFGLGALVILKPVIGLITNDQVVLDFAYQRFMGIGIFLFLCGTMNALSYSLRAIGKSLTAMFIAVFAGCIFRIIYVEIIYALTKNFTLIYSTYPVSWVITIALYLIAIIPAMKKLKIKFEAQKKELS
ncbi:MAG: MATE family efflux transporter [Clostridiales bacterium]|nr:MATE family efflux transporter [Clostridiales bacterium]